MIGTRIGLGSGSGSNVGRTGARSLGHLVSHRGRRLAFSPWQARGMCVQERCHDARPDHPWWNRGGRDRRPVPRGPTSGCATARIVAIGEVEEPASASIDADGLMVTPGFVDLHTHYDAQLSWDPTASPSPLHGVTTVIGGNCGFSLAPAGPDNSDYLARMMARVEGMPLAALEFLDWSWSSFGEWLGRFDGAIGVNAGFLVGHSTLRRAVMGDDAVGDAATDEQIAAMVALAERSFEEGALGLSTSQAHTHNDGDGEPVPSRAASRRELEALCPRRSQHTPGTTLELILPGCINGFTEDEVDLMATLSLLANRPANWNVLGVSSLNPAGLRAPAGRVDVAAERGAKVVALTLPHTMKIRLSLRARRGHRRPTRLARDASAFRSRAHEAPCRPGRPADGWTRAPTRRRPASSLHLAHWQNLVIDETFSSGERGTGGPHGGAIAAERGQEPFDALVDVALADELRTGLRPPIPESEADWELRGEGVGGPTDGRRRLRRRCPPRHDVRRDLLDLDARGRGAQARAAELGVGDPRADRRASPSLRLRAAGDGSTRDGSPTWW